MNKKSILFLLLIFSFSLFALFSFYVYKTLSQPQFSLNKKVEIYIKPGSSFNEIVSLLYQNRIIKNKILFKFYMIFQGKHKYIKAGYYLFDKPLNIFQLADKLTKGQILYYKITIPEGSNLFDIKEILKKNNLLAGKDFFSLIHSNEIMNEIKEINSDIKSPEGYLFPETYYLSKEEDVSLLIKRMIREFKKRYLEKLQSKSKISNFSVNELVTLASLIEKETGYSKEKPLIASVFYNRLRLNMKLQCDPTVYYAFYLLGKFPLLLTKEDLLIDSPYNTYRYYGLPPTPICNPGHDSIEAVLNPAESKYLYFVSKHDGTHYFSTNLKEHNAAVSLYNK